MPTRDRSAVLRLLGALASLALLLGGCAGSGSASPFSWLRPSAAPAGWQVARIATGATLYYPPGWRPAPGDPGTATAVLLDPARHIGGYLNVTPRQGAEAPATWGEFRVAHNASEGDRDVKREATAAGLRFRDGRGACVRDSYTTVSRARFVELACLVEGARAASVIVAAASPGAWSRLVPQLRRAISAFET